MQFTLLLRFGWEFSLAAVLLDFDTFPEACLPSAAGFWVENTPITHHQEVLARWTNV